MGNRNKKRFLIFIVVPILAAIPFFTEDFILRLITSIVLVVYVGFIIFLRDSMRPDDRYEDSNIPASDSKDFNDDDSSEPKYDTDQGEDFKIISQQKNLEVINDENYSPSVGTQRRSIFKPYDLKENYEKIANEDVPDDITQDEQFSFVLEKLLNVIKEAYLAHTAIFFWYNSTKKRLTLEQSVSNSGDITEQKFEIENDILSKIVQKEEPEILTDITSNAERDVIRYYSSPQGIKAFIGVPLFYANKLAGVLALDSKSPDAFGIETIYSLGRFVRVISIMISLFEEKFVESQSEQRLKALLGVLSTDKRFESQEELWQAIENSVRNLINWDAFTFVFFDPKEQKFKTSKIINNTSLKYAGEFLEVELNNTLVGKAVLSGVPVKIDDTSAHEYIRFAKSEDVSFDGSFMAVPLIYDEENYGVFCFESLKKSFYTNSDVQFVKNAVKIFSFLVYSYSTTSMLKSLLSLDIETKTFSRNTFIERVNSDLLKAEEAKVSSALALIQIDEFLEQDSLFEGDPFPKILSSITSAIKEEQTPLSFTGRLNEKTFGVYFFNASTKDIFLWAEKLRIKIARKPISVVLKQTTFTVSIGVASSTGNADANELIRNAELALNKAIEKGGNTVKSLN